MNSPASAENPEPRVFKFGQKTKKEVPEISDLMRRLEETPMNENLLVSQLAELPNEAYDHVIDLIDSPKLKQAIQAHRQALKINVKKWKDDDIEASPQVKPQKLSRRKFLERGAQTAAVLAVSTKVSDSLLVNLWKKLTTGPQGEDNGKILKAALLGVIQDDDSILKALSDEIQVLTSKDWRLAQAAMTDVFMENLALVHIPTNKKYGTGPFKVMVGYSPPDNAPVKKSGKNTVFLIAGVSGLTSDFHDLLKFLQAQHLGIFTFLAPGKGFDGKYVPTEAFTLPLIMKQFCRDMSQANSDKIRNNLIEQVAKADEYDQLEGFLLEGFQKQAPDILKKIRSARVGIVAAHQKEAGTLAKDLSRAMSSGRIREIARRKDYDTLVNYLPEYLKPDLMNQLRSAHQEIWDDPQLFGDWYGQKMFSADGFNLKLLIRRLVKMPHIGDPTVKGNSRLDFVIDYLSRKKRWLIVEEIQEEYAAVNGNTLNVSYFSTGQYTKNYMDAAMAYLHDVLNNGITIEDMDIEKTDDAHIDVIGHSLGTMVATDMAARAAYAGHPFHSLTLVASPIDLGDKLMEYYKQARQDAKLTVDAISETATVSTEIANALGLPIPIKHGFGEVKKVLDGLYNMKAPPSGTKMPNSAIDSVNCPALFIQGGRDTFATPAEPMQIALQQPPRNPFPGREPVEYNGKAPIRTLFYIKDADHGSMFARPAVSKVLDAFYRIQDNLPPEDNCADYSTPEPQFAHWSNGEFRKEINRLQRK